jgi:hypothetical protein
LIVPEHDQEIGARRREASCEVGDRTRAPRRTFAFHVVRRLLGEPRRALAQQRVEVVRRAAVPVIAFRAVGLLAQRPLLGRDREERAVRGRERRDDTRHRA